MTDRLETIFVISFFFGSYGIGYALLRPLLFGRFPDEKPIEEPPTEIFKIHDIMSSTTFSSKSSHFWIQLLSSILTLFGFIGVTVQNSEQVATDAVTTISSGNWSQIAGFLFAVGIGLAIKIAKAAKMADWGAFIRSQNTVIYILTAIVALIGIYNSNLVSPLTAVLPFLTNIIIRWFGSKDPTPTISDEMKADAAMWIGRPVQL